MKKKKGEVGRTRRGMNEKRGEEGRRRRRRRKKRE